MKAQNETIGDLNGDGVEDDADIFQLDITDFFDLTDEEYENEYLNSIIPEEELLNSETPSQDAFITGNETEADNLRHLQSTPTSFDWRDHGALGPIKRQGSCGACYSFSAAATLESQYYIKYGQMLDLSEQQIINCNPYSTGCRGGNIALVFRYLQNSAGLGLESETRYVQRKEICSQVKPAVKVKQMLWAGTKDEAKIAAFLVKNGPLSIAINANLFKYYKGGIMKYNSSQCNSRNLNHAVNIVGYGVSRLGTKYWIVRNTWGPTWGENGYLRVKWGTCGVNQYVMGAVIE